MPSSQRASVIQFLRAVRPVVGPTDGELLGRFIAHRDGTAFAELVRRHGAMVLGVCRRLLCHEQDAEDAFQAAFLVLARKAASVVPREAVGGWLYGVACRTAQGARARRNRREARERPMDDLSDRAAPTGPDRVWEELLPALDRELSRLPEKYRLPVVLCELEGRPRREIARQLGVPEGTLSSRLATARKLLARRLGLGGAVLPAGALALADVPAALAASTVEAASRFAAGRAVAGALRTGAAALTEGVMKAMLIKKLGIATTLVFGVLLVVGASTLGRQALAGDPPVTTASGTSSAPGAPPGGQPPSTGGLPGTSTTQPPGGPTTGGLPGSAPQGVGGGGSTPPSLPGGGGSDPTKARQDPERRLAEMERKLQQLQQKVEALEKELRTLRGLRGGTGGGGKGLPGGAGGLPGGGGGLPGGGGGGAGGAKQRSTDRTEIRIYKLKNNNAEAIVAALTKVLFESGEKSGRVIAVGTNQILASASADTLREIDDIIQKLADAPSSAK